MKLLLLGAGGQLGTQLRRSLAPLGELVLADRADADFTRPETLVEAVRRHGPDVVVNAAAYTAVDQAEADAATAFAVNAQACGVLAREAAASGAWLVHFSTDYVFDGSGERPWTEDDVPAPLNVYGQSKLAGEQVIAQSCERHLIFRTSWLFDTVGSNFLKSILRRARHERRLQVVDDEFGAPTRAAYVADATAHVLRRLTPQQAGTYHVASAGSTSWNAYARAAIGMARASGMALAAGAEDVDAISAATLGRAARRPGNSRLSTDLFARTFGLHAPRWEEGVRQVVGELASLERNA